MSEITSRKIKIVGTETYINQKTGELQEMQVINVEERDFNFHKLWLTHIISTLDIVGNKKVKLVFWIVENLNSENQLIMTYRQIAKKSGISIDTVNDTMKVLLENNFLVRINQGAYQVNPDIIFKGSRSNRLNVLYQYTKAKHESEEAQLE